MICHLKYLMEWHTFLCVSQQQWHTYRSTLTNLVIQRLLLVSLWKYCIVVRRASRDVIISGVTAAETEGWWFFSGLSIRRMWVFFSLMDCFVGWYFQSSLFFIHSYNFFKSDRNIFRYTFFHKIYFSRSLWWKRRQCLKILKVINLSMSYTLNFKLVRIQPHLRSTSGVHRQLRKNIYRKKSSCEIIWKCWSCA